jgi:hypothetical protein
MSTDVHRLGCHLAVSRAAPAGDPPRGRPRLARGVRIWKGTSGHGARGKGPLRLRGRAAGLPRSPRPRVSILSDALGTDLRGEHRRAVRSSEN